MPNQFPEAQQQNLITLLCWSNQHGQLVANLAEPGWFDGDYRDIALAATDYWRRYGAPPKEHTADLFAHRLESNDRRANSLRRCLMSMTQLQEQINAEYVINQIQNFARRQSLKDAVLRAAQVLNNDQAPVEDAEAALNDVLKARHIQFDPGVRLDDDLDAFLDYLARRRNEFMTGIEPLDQAGIVPVRQGIVILVGGKGRGKSWFLTTVGKNALMFRKRVLHITLEMEAPEVRQRYYQALWAVPKHAVKGNRIDVPRIRYGREPNRNTDVRPVNGFQTESVPVDFSFRSSALRHELETRILALGGKVENLVIKRFPNGQLTPEMLEAYLDTLDQTQHFQPDMLLLDYPRLMKQNNRNAKDRRISIGQNVETLRAMAIEHNFALVAVDQLNRRGNEKGEARSTDIGEDISQIFTADGVLTLSSTEAERRMGLARIFVDHYRGERDQFGVLMTQAYDIGQFALEAVRMPDNYFNELAPGLSQGEANDEDEVEEDDE